jgi:pimeloyl-ACP methyl ester carboxylesterase
MNEINFNYAQIGAVNLHYAKAGEGEKLVILLHGFPESWYSWRHQIEAFSNDYTVVAPDMRGYNLSDKPSKISDYSIDKLVDDVIGLIRYFGRDQAVIVGHDLGAAIAWSIALKHPEYVSKLVAMQVPPSSIWKKNQTLKQLLASWYMFFFQIPLLPEYLLRLDDYAAMKNALENTTFEKGVFTEEDISAYKKSWSEPYALTAMLNYYRANVIGRFVGKSNPDVKIKVPTIFIYGEKDQAVLPETVKGVGEAMAAPFEEFRIPYSGHWVQNEAKDTVNEILRDFLADNL